ncbi:sigma-70 family RNA polymerase sigma factor [Pseudovibrio exalbescens]|uniref:sigma-70 family RNA polymerase sigma factor n=1 Tax=Pseudovibrio exalbescens TaxID=197461 RepID=UPI000C9B8E06|nr:sigma-70 family RNA polymerase sigma factor [Pseudovibrio exalbescens]
MNEEAPSFKSQLLGHLPSLRAFARSLSGSADRADDLVQDTLMKAWSKQSSFEAGTNLRAWLFTILRNEFLTQARKQGREQSSGDPSYADGLAVLPEQPSSLDLKDLRAALKQLPDDQREAIVLVGALGMSYEEAAEICGCALGTLKSRVNRARSRLCDLMQVGNGAEFGPESEITGIATAQAPI